MRRLATLAKHQASKSMPLCSLDERVESIVSATERRIMSLFDRFGSSDYIGEPCTITEHSVQTANAAAKAGECDLTVLSCLLHDVGHLAGLEAGFEPGMDGCGTPEHERIGAELLRALGLPETCAYLTHKHVEAKRYLCATQPEYYERLTNASKTTLRHQGGPMSLAEVAEAESDARWPVVLRMRTYDEAGKDERATYTNMQQFLPLLRSVLRASITERVAAADDASVEQHGAVALEASVRRADADAALEAACYPLSIYADAYVLSGEQLRFWDEHGYLVLRGALPPSLDAAALSAMADEVAALPCAPCYPWLIHHERSQHDGAVRICRVENFCKHHHLWADLAFGFVQSVVSQAFGSKAKLFKDKINYKGPVSCPPHTN